MIAFTGTWRSRFVGLCAKRAWARAQSRNRRSSIWRVVSNALWMGSWATGTTASERTRSAPGEPGQNRAGDGQKRRARNLLPARCRRALTLRPSREAKSMPAEALPQKPDPFPATPSSSSLEDHFAHIRPDRAESDAFASLEHRQLRDGEFWREVPPFSRVDAATFMDPHWQLKNSVRSPSEISAFLRGTGHEFVADVERGLALAPMSIRITPYILSLIDWRNPREDRLRRQFLPLASEKLPDHPISVLDALGERSHSPAERLTHRYPDRVLLISVDVCPVYCRYCTRSYSVGANTNKISKFKHVTTGSRWAAAFEYIRTHPAVEDVVISGGDTYMLKPDEVRVIGNTLLDIPHVRRM